MKYVTFQSNLLFFRVYALLLFAFSGCSKENSTIGTVSLNDIVSRSSFASLPLVGTQWKLIGFAHQGKNTIKIAERDCGDCFVLTFNEDGTLSGRTASNQASGRYELVETDEGGIVIVVFGGETMMGEWGDGNSFVSNMADVSRFSIGQRGLELNHGDKTFMLFQPME